MDFKGKRILVTGATGGIGGAIVEKFLSLNASVLGTGTNFDKLNGVNFIEPDNKKFPYLNILKKNKFKNTYYEIILVTLNDKLVNLFLKNKISFIKMQKLLLKLIGSNTLKKYYEKQPKNIKDIFIMVDKVKKHLNEYEKFF